MKSNLVYLLFVLNFISSSDALAILGREGAHFFVEAEGGSAWQGRNNVASPGDTGTRFSLRDTIKSPKPYFRIEAEVPLAQKHELRFLYAPFSVSGTGRLRQPVFYEGLHFGTHVDTSTKFKFNSYRLTYRYGLAVKQPWIMMIGFTAKIRDAEIALEQPHLQKSKSNIGFVPLLHFYFSRQLFSNFRFEIEGDAAAAKQGRAEDFSLKLWHDFEKSKISAALGYRILEGGADNPEVYTFALIHYANATLSYAF